MTDVFAEIRLPIFLDRDFTRELTLDAAIRQADYSTSGKANTWKVGATWAPIDDVRFRGTVSEAVRAPNISELFDPRLPITVAASSDPCASTNINNGTDAREGNCVAALTAIGVSQDAIFTDGVYDWTNPLTARFNGVYGDHASPALVLDVDHVPPAVHRERVRLLVRVEAPDGLRRLLEGAIIGVDLHLGDDAHDLVLKATPSELFAERPLHHIPKAALGVRHERVEGNLMNVLTTQLGTKRHEAHLRSVSVGDDEALSRLNQVGDGHHRLSGELELVLHRRCKLGADQGISPHRHDAQSTIRQRSPLLKDAR